MKLRDRVRRIERGESIAEEGSPAERCFTLFSGMAFRYRFTHEGRRQILDLIFPGDFIGLDDDGDGLWTYSVAALSASYTCSFASEPMRQMVGHNSEIASGFIGWVQREHSMLYRRVLDLGEDAETRIVHLILEVYWQLAARNMARDGRCAFPLSQAQIADTVGLTKAHVNRVLARLRSDGLAAINNDHVVIGSPERLAERYGFETDYLRRALM